jgi:DNA-binding MarR family transcriptional regulator
MSKTKTADNLATGGVSVADIEIAGNLRTVIQRMVKVLRKHTRNEEMLSLTERSTLGLLYQHGQLLPTELAQMEKVTTQSISQVVAHLVEIAYIKKTPAESDKRKAYLSLTPAGKDYIERLRQEKQEWLARILHEKTTAREKELLSEALAILGKLIEE